MNNSVNIGVIGCGTVAIAVHIPSLKRIPEAKIIGVADAAKGRAKEVSEKFNIGNFYTDYHDLLKIEGLDAVVIAVPNWLHAEIATAAAEFGKNILIQKPLATNLRDCKRMIEAARRSGVKLIPCFMWRFREDIQFIKKMIDQKLIGEIHILRSQFGHTGAYIPWFYDPEKSGGGVLLDLGVHHIDVLRWFAGNVRSVMAMTSTHRKERKLPNDVELHDIKVEDDANMLLRFHNNALGILTASWNQRAGFQGFEIYGSEGTIIADARTGEVKMFSESAVPDRLKTFALPYDIDVTGPRLTFNMQQLYTTLTDPALRAHRNFVNSILEREEPVATAEDASADVEAIIAGYISARKGTEVSIPISTT